jgi:adenine deaminase
VFHVEHFFFKNIIMKIDGHYVDLETREIYPAEIYISGTKIESINRISSAPGRYIIPGLIDSHIHIESSMVAPAAFGEMAVKHGTVAVVSDPHEIANILGPAGVEFMINEGKRSPLKFFFGAPSCVPATDFESSGGRIDSGDVARLLEREEIKFLSEMMNFPGVIYDDPEVRKKIEIARILNKPVDGHAPGLRGEKLRKYIEAGISTDHECTSLEEALEKIGLGMKILIREGSAAKNLDSLKELFRLRPEMIMLCSDDLHPEMLVKGHINRLVSKLIKEGFDVFDVLRSATLNPSVHYNLGTGMLRAGDEADFIVTESLDRLEILQTWIAGKIVFDAEVPDYRSAQPEALNNFNCNFICEQDIAADQRTGSLRVIEARDGDLFTKQLIMKIKSSDEYSGLVKDDILKLVLKERYKDAPAVTAYIGGLGLKKGAFATSVSHDSHNIVAAGTNDSDLVAAVNEVVRLKGGLAVSIDGKISSLQLAIGGIMSVKSVEEVAAEYTALDDLVKECGSPMSAPFMTLSFMALLVIPELKISDRGLFDGTAFRTISLFAD